MSDVLLEARGVSKRYRVRTERSLALGLTRRARPKDVWALRELDLEVRAGEVVAVIGRNGAGKSTLLKLASGVARPTTGTLRRPERLAPLIEVGAGFHPELTGRENVGVNARLLGLSGRQIAAVFDDVVEFAQLADVIDQPVRQYSSGMFMRLGFAVAIHTDPQVLVVDEVLAVGDLPFQVRCLDRIRELRADGVGVLFVSHNLTAVLSLADRALLLNRGVVETTGDAPSVVGRYHEMLAQGEGAGQIGDDAGSTGELALQSFRLLDEHGGAPDLWQPGQRCVFEVTVEAVRDVEPGIIGFRVNKDGAGMVAAWRHDDGPHVPAMRAGERAVLRAGTHLNLTSGGYSVDVAVVPRSWDRLMLTAHGVASFGMAARPGSAGTADLVPTLDVERG